MSLKSLIYRLTTPPAPGKPPMSGKELVTELWQLLKQWAERNPWIHLLKQWVERNWWIHFVLLPIYLVLFGIWYWSMWFFLTCVVFPVMTILGLCEFVGSLRSGVRKD